MSGITDLDVLLQNMEPQLRVGEFVFCTIKSSSYEVIPKLKPIACFLEDEGMTLVLNKKMAELEGFDCTSVFKAITLTVHSSLDAVGLTAAVSNKLACRGISANVIAAYYHDHIFVQVEKADQALAALREFGDKVKR
ncbi:ACT domain-containing protein [Photobacterium sp. SDRW27]|uniref:ACT domain-containing protein n=1 Tax=Photobacterium obscurum TaxID=2829490 RepID=UPI002244CABE|nr:ACT domain-containing protein [Photobacterium obscurum]MCW8329440.1 ACT domain-containing protein [Photobacterium obscurum]